MDILLSLFDATLLNSAFRFVTPILLAALGGALCQRVGVFNIALEGLMLTGAFAAVAGSYFFNNGALGVLTAVLASALLAAVFALFTVTFGSDEIAPISRFVVRLFWRAFQILTGKGRTTPAKDACLRAKHDTQMYEWARKQLKLILIAGHTHRPVWSSMTHLQQLSLELDTLEQLPPAERPADYSTKLERLQDEIRVREAKYPPCNDTIKTQPSYFNTGCCCFEDGDITGIELDAGQIRLVKWGGDNGAIARQCLRQSQLSELFAAI